MKKIRQILFVFFLLIIYIYVSYITFFPNNIIIFEGEKLNLNTIFGIGIKEEQSINKYTEDTKIMQTSKNITENKINKIGKTNLTLNLFDSFPLKKVEVNVVKKTKVIPLGNAIGLKLYTKGVMVVGMSEIEGQDNINYKPYENCGIKEGDLIIAVNNSNISTIDELINKVNNSNRRKNRSEIS